jgi:hypothetical protein
MATKRKIRSGNPSKAKLSLFCLFGGSYSILHSIVLLTSQLSHFVGWIFILDII